MVKTYTAEERAERRRRSSELGSSSERRRGGRPTPLIEEDEASWIADLRAQGVDVAEFLTEVFVPPEAIGVPDERGRSGGGISREISETSGSVQSGRSMPRRMSQEQRALLENRLSISERAKERFSQFMDKSYEVCAETGDLVMKNLDEMSKERWQREVKEDSRNYDPSGTTPEKIRQNKEWAVKMALRRAAEAGYKPSQSSDTSDDASASSATSNASNKSPIYPTVAPPPTEPLPPIDEDDFRSVSDVPLNPRELGLFPPPMSHKLIDLVPKVQRTHVGIADGILFMGSAEQGWESCDSETMVVLCSDETCRSLLHCPRSASLVRCEVCSTVSPACPESSICQDDRARGDDLSDLGGDGRATTETGTSRSKSWRDTRNTSRTSMDTDNAVRGDQSARNSSGTSINTNNAIRSDQGDLPGRGLV